MRTFICTVVKDEHRFIREWADHHLRLGVDEIYVYEDYESKPHAEIFADEPRVHVSSLENFGVPNYPNSRRQYETFCKFAREAKEKELCDWALFTDIDEFLMFEDGWNMERLEEAFADVPAVWLSWKTYGAGGHIKRPEGGVVESYTVPSAFRPDRANRWNIKSLVNVKRYEGFTTLHHAIGGVNTNRDGDLDSELCYDKAWINHYFTKSWEDYCDRILRRGNFSNNFRSFDNFFSVNPDMLERRAELMSSIPSHRAEGLMWISRELGLISGGNMDIIRNIESKLRNQ